jgi:hypothetical protein
MVRASSHIYASLAVKPKKLTVYESGQIEKIAA